MKRIFLSVAALLALCASAPACGIQATAFVGASYCPPAIVAVQTVQYIAVPTVQYVAQPVVVEAVAPCASAAVEVQNYGAVVPAVASYGFNSFNSYGAGFDSIGYGAGFRSRAFFGDRFGFNRFGGGFNRFGGRFNRFGVGVSFSGVDVVVGGRGFGHRGFFGGRRAFARTKTVTKTKSFVRG